MRSLVGCLVLVVSIAGLAAGAGSAAPAAAPCEVTESDGFGPFGRGGSPPARAVFGKGFVLSGKVLRSLDCKQLANATVEIWQAGKGGVYDKRGRASIVTGKNGAFKFTGPPPVSYEGVTPHIHVRVSHEGYDEVATTVRVTKNAKGAQLEIVLGSLL
ncbi:MAG: intradiol ring-cleavage dioxygenase [Actinobacteria bacterium]|nr:intradiol ring-cleavage dioxygenase [Actinomycetota bacterium]